MAKRVFTFGAVLMLAVSAYLYRNLSQGTEIVAEIDKLLAQGKEELEPCQVYKTKLAKLDSSHLDSESASHASKEEALSALDLLETYPGTPPSYYRAALAFRENHELLSHRVDQVALRFKETEIQGECDIFSMYKHGALLLKDIHAFSFDKQQTARVRGLLTAYLKSEIPSNSLIAIAIRATLLERYLSAGHSPEKTALIGRTRGFMDLFEQKRMMVAQEWRQKSGWHEYLLSARGPEIDAVKELSLAYVSILKDAKI